MPYSVDINDVILHRRGQEADDFARQIRDTSTLCTRKAPNRAA